MDIERTELELAWEDAGSVDVDVDGQLYFPALSARPGVYELRFIEDGALRSFVGESDSIRRDIESLAVRDPADATVARIRAEIVDHYDAGGRVLIMVCEAGTVDMAPGPLDLTQHAARSMAYGARLMHLRSTGIEILNRS